MILYQISNVISIFTCLIAILINLTIIRIHAKQPLLMSGFFHVVFGQVITELIVNISLLLVNFVYVIKEDKAEKFIAAFPAFFNLGYIANITYNIRILIFLMTYNTNREELINYENKNNSDNDNLTHQNSLAFVGLSFKNFHIIAILVSIIHTALYIVNLMYQAMELQSDNWFWFYYFIYGAEYWYRILFFIPHFMYFILSFIYLIQSCNKNKISNHIYLRSFSLYNFFSSFISLFFPIVLLIHWLGFKEGKDPNNPFRGEYLVILLFAFLGFLLASSIYRLECYYVHYILTREGKNCLHRWGYALKILFCVQKMERLNFVDLNSSFIYHALSSANDFLSDANEDIEEGTQMMDKDGD